MAEGSVSIAGDANNAKGIEFSMPEVPLAHAILEIANERRSSSTVLLQWLVGKVTAFAALLFAAFGIVGLYLWFLDGNHSLDSIVLAFQESRTTGMGLVFVAVLLSALHWWNMKPNYPDNTPRIGYDPQSESFNMLRRRTFPPPYPNGWYLLCQSSDLVAGAPPRAYSVLGREIIAFRGEDRRAGVLDAHCPHLGAHLGVEGRVVGNCVECPFHQWKFDRDGKCQSIPYIDNAPPRNANAVSYETRERINCVFFWFDAEGRPPHWEPMIPARLEDGSMYYGGVTELRFNMHIAEMAENSADPYHFNNLHSPFPLPILDKFIRLLHRIDLCFPTGRPEGSHQCLFREHATPYLFGRIPLSPEQTTNLVFDGPSFVHFMLNTPFGRVHLFKSALPIAPLRVVTEDRWYADHTVPRWLGWLLAKIGRNALEQDRSVWENKVYREKPCLVRGEASFSKHRRWYSQFFSESSVRFNTPAPLAW